MNCSKNMVLRWRKAELKNKKNNIINIVNKLIEEIKNYLKETDLDDTSINKINLIKKLLEECLKIVDTLKIELRFNIWDDIFNKKINHILRLTKKRKKRYHKERKPWKPEELENFDTPKDPIKWLNKKIRKKIKEILYISTPSY